MSEEILVGDVVSDLYYGRVMHPQAQRICRDRIHWICSQVKGPGVIDVGCSQGIVPLLLGMEGLQVLGVDIYAKSIDHANQELSTLPKEIQERVQFMLADINALELSAIGQFDTLILTEVIEHFSHPARIIESSIRFLKDKGQIVLTTPFGFKPSKDHKYTFTLSDFLQIIAPYFKVKRLEVQGGYIQFVGTKEPDAERGLQYTEEQILKLVEAGLLESQELLNERLRNFRYEVNQRDGRVLTLENKLVGEKEKFSRRYDELSEKLKKANLRRTEESEKARARASQLSAVRKEQESERRRGASEKKKREKLEESLRSYYDLVESLQAEVEELKPIPHTIAYQLGRAVLDGVGSVRGFIKLPFRLVLLMMEALRRRSLTKQQNENSALESGDEIERDLQIRYVTEGKEALLVRAEEYLRSPKGAEKYVHGIIFRLLHRVHFWDALPHAISALQFGVDNPSTLERLVDQANLFLRQGEYDSALQVASGVADALGESVNLPDAGAYRSAADSGIVFPVMRLNEKEHVVFAMSAGITGENLDRILQEQGVEGVEQLVSSSKRFMKFEPLELEQNVFQHLQSSQPEMALEYGEKVHRVSNNQEFGKRVSDFRQRCEHRKGKIEVLEATSRVRKAV